MLFTLVRLELERSTFSVQTKLTIEAVQFPVSFKNADDTRDYLFALLEKFREYPLVPEIRHQS